MEVGGGEERNGRLDCNVWGETPAAAGCGRGRRGGCSGGCGGNGGDFSFRGGSRGGGKRFTRPRPVERSTGGELCQRGRGCVSNQRGGAATVDGPPPPTLYERWTTATRSTLCGDNWAGTLPALLTLPAALTGVPERFSRRGGRWPLVPVNNTVLVRRPFPPSLTSCHHVFLSITATAADAELRGKGEDARRTERR